MPAATPACDGLKFKLPVVRTSGPRSGAEFDCRAGDPILVRGPADRLRTYSLRLGGIGKSAAADQSQGQILAEKSPGNGKKPDEREQSERAHG